MNCEWCENTIGKDFTIEEKVKTLFFCCEECREEYLNDQERLSREEWESETFWYAVNGDPKI